MATITQAVVDEFNKIAYWDDTKKAWCYREDRYGAGNIGIMKHKGDVISVTNGDGYYMIKMFGRQYRLHRLAYCAYHNIVLDDKVILDHVNGARTDNSKENLRESSHTHNNHNKIKKANTSSQYVGVSWYKRRKKWRANIKENGKLKYLGLFIKEVDAAHAYNVAASKIYGDMAKLNVIN